MEKITRLGRPQKSHLLRRSIAERLRAARMAYNPCAKDVAAALGILPQTLSSYETGLRYPSKLFLVQFCELTKCPAHWLFCQRMQASTAPDLAAALQTHFSDLIESGEPCEPLSRDDLLCVVGFRLRVTRMLYDSNTRRVAKALGVNVQVLSSCELGKNFPDEALLMRFCDLVGCPVDWILRGHLTVEMGTEMACIIAEENEHLLGATVLVEAATAT